MYDEEHEHRVREQMADIEAVPSSSEPTAEELASIAMETNVQEVGGAAAGNASSAALASATADSSLSQSSASETQAGSQVAADTADAPEVAAPGEGPGSAVRATSASNVAPSDDAGGAAVDAGNVAASPEAGQFASDTASSAQAASLVVGIAADVSLGEPSTAHNWLSLLERKLAVLEHDARDELLDVVRQLREAL